MAMYLLTWNPKIWDGIDECLKEIKTKGYTEIDWSCANSQPQNGDSFFIMKVSTKNNGIFCSGVVDSFVKNTHSESNKTKKLNTIHGTINILLNPKKDNILDVNILKEKFKIQRWEPQQSGIEIKPDIQDEFLDLWLNFINKNKKYKNVKKELFEGNTQQKLYTFQERNIYAREECLKHYGYTCQICKKSLEDIYGEIGKNFIHVHHINFLANTKGTHKVDPIKDLIPVCPNCHSMLHVKYNGNYVQIDELKQYYKSKH